MFAVPVASRITVIGLQIAIGAILSVTVVFTVAAGTPCPLSGGLLITLAVLFTDGSELQVGTTVIIF